MSPGLLANRRRSRRAEVLTSAGFGRINISKIR
jgi:hypothetical protein